jgi:hypothetical protein
VLASAVEGHEARTGRIWEVCAGGRALLKRDLETHFKVAGLLTPAPTKNPSYFGLSTVGTGIATSGISCAMLGTPPAWRAARAARHPPPAKLPFLFSRQAFVRCNTEMLRLAQTISHLAGCTPLTARLGWVVPERSLNLSSRSSVKRPAPRRRGPTNLVSQTRWPRPVNQGALNP